MLRMITNRSPSPKLKPLPRAAQARLPPPLMEGIANKQEPLPRAACAASPSPYEGTEKVKSTFRLKANDR